MDQPEKKDAIAFSKLVLGFLCIVIVVALVARYTNNRPPIVIFAEAPDGATCSVTLDKFHRLQQPVELRVAQSIIGCKGELIVEQDFGTGAHFKGYRWLGSDGGWMTVTFNDGKLAWKQQVGLK